MFNKLGLTLLITFCIQSVVFSIENDSTKRKTQIGFAVGGDYCFRTLTVEESEFGGINHYEFMRNMGGETWKFGYRLQVDLVQPLSKKFNLITGLKYSERGYQRKTVHWTDDKLIYEVGEAAINFQMTYLSIPLKLEFEQNLNKCSFFVNAGLGFEYMIRNAYKAKIDYSAATEIAVERYQRTERLVSWSPITWEENHHRLMVSALGELGMGIPVKNGVNFRISSTANYSLTSVFQSPVNERLWSIGIKAGFNFDL
ncbi:MAG: outer membrane beta-barrel protein [Crocinitomix sp.]|nr:outer membrane beta-barrel protein [Crocinitomix sp.]